MDKDNIKNIVQNDKFDSILRIMKEKEDLGNYKTNGVFLRNKGIAKLLNEEMRVDEILLCYKVYNKTSEGVLGISIDKLPEFKKENKEKILLFIEELKNALERSINRIIK